jgi:hypothetical protein
LLKEIKLNQKTKTMIVAETSQKSNFELVPAGNQIARCYSMIEIGTVEEEFQGEKKTLKKVRITWELPLETKVFKPENGEQPYSISKEYTLSMHEKANLRRDLESWRGKGFSETEAVRFDITKLLGVPCMLNVIHKVSKGGNDFAAISSITPLAKGTSCPDQVNKSFEFGYAEFSQAKFDSLPEWLRDKMKVTPEYKKATQSAETKEEPVDDVLLDDKDEFGDLPF